jgi:hypothetical protein
MFTMHTEETAQGVLKGRRPFSILLIVALTVALMVVDAADGFIAWSAFGVVGSTLVLSIHWCLTETPQELVGYMDESDDEFESHERVAG